MSQVPHSPGIALSHMAATSETIHLQQESITPDLFFCGITKLQDLLEPALLKKVRVPTQMIPSALAENQQLIQLLENFGLVPRLLRHTLRERIGKGDYEWDENDHVPRSQAVRDAFTRANDIAAENSPQIVMVSHLMVALLEIPDTQTHALLQELEVDIDALCEAAVSLPMLPPIRLPDEGLLPPRGLLARYGTDLTAKAQQGELALVIGRKDEMLKVIHILGRSKKNCPVLVGAPGVGKTAIVEGLAQRIAVRNIHRDFHHKRIIQIEASSLVSGTKYRGDFEERMETLLAEVTNNPDVILFIDEIHLLVGAGAGSSAMDAANILKPALESGKIKLIGATTEAEYRQYIEKDAALERRFEPIRVEEPSAEETLKMLTGVRQQLQNRHAVTIQDDAIIAAVQLSVRYITDRKLPDKAYTLLDDACLRVKYGSHISLNAEDDPDEIGFMLVTASVIREVLADRLGIPIGDLSDDMAKRIMHIADALRQRVVGQDAAIQSVSATLQRYYAKMQDQNRPIGIFLFVGPTGVGKTELAKATAAFLFGSERRMIRLDMSEYSEKNHVNRLLGSPPGYIGYEESGYLTNKLHETPFTVVLIDEIEKAHPEVLNVFLQLFDEGRLTDAQGRTVDGKNALFILTSNLGYDTVGSLPPREAVLQAVYQKMRPEFINRLDEIVHFQPLQPEHMESLVHMQLSLLAERLDPHAIALDADPEAIRWLAENGYDPGLGARALIRLVREKVVNPIAARVLMGQISAHAVARISLEEGHIKIKEIIPDTNYGETKA